jgi:hypothetical protein
MSNVLKLSIDTDPRIVPKHQNTVMFHVTLGFLHHHDDSDDDVQTSAVVIKR